MMIKSILGSVLVVLSYVSNFSTAAAASTSDFECFKEGAGTEICMVIPDDAPMTVAKPAPPSKKTLLPVPQQAAMISKHELSGEALSLDNEFSFDTAFNQADTLDLVEENINQPALATSLKSQESMRWIETFLKTGPSGQSDDIFVRPSAKAK
jgi:hypothetical protein